MSPQVVNFDPSEILARVQKSGQVYAIDSHEVKADHEMLAREQQKEFDRNQTFLDMQRGPNPLTNAEIEKLATKDPDRWGKFRGMGKGGE